MNKISDRRKKTPHNPLSNDDEGALLRMGTNFDIINSSPPTIEEMKKMIHRL